ncbi:hypothetical protein QR685DRAFT_431960, partial [Neurospora intermedia]
INILIYLFRYKLKVFYIPEKLNFVLNTLNHLKAISNNGNPNRTVVPNNI